MARTCAICGKKTGAMAAFLSLLSRWGLAGKSMFAHPECISKEQAKRREVRNGIHD